MSHPSKPDPPTNGDPAKLSDVEMKKAMAGFYFHGNQTKTPMDFLYDEVTGRPPATSKDPWGVRTIDLREGISNVDLPAAVFWRRGEWLSDMEEKDQPLVNVTEELSHDMWVVTGEGMPNNYLYYVYLLPSVGQKAPTTYEVPQHPVLWAQRYKKGKGKLGTQIIGSEFGQTADFASGKKNDLLWDDDDDDRPVWFYSGGSYKSQHTTPKTPMLPATPQQTQAITKAKTAVQKLPAGMRLRCRGCGHWFKEDDLKPHAENVCPGMDGNNGESDWGLMCAPECGCKTLHEAVTLKPGYPKLKPKKKEVIENEQTEATTTTGVETDKHDKPTPTAGG